MPTAHCNFPEHHGPGKSGPGALLVAIIAGAIVVYEWRTVAVVLAVVVALAVTAAAVSMLWHSHTAEPYDASWSVSEPQEGEIQAGPATYSAQVLQARVVQLERQLAERQAIAAPVVHQHLHLHGVEPADVAAIVRQHNAIEEN
jgi:hypothetical protein